MIRILIYATLFQHIMSYIVIIWIYGIPSLSFPPFHSTIANLERNHLNLWINSKKKSTAALCHLREINITTSRRFNYNEFIDISYFTRRQVVNRRDVFPTNQLQQEKSVSGWVWTRVVRVLVGTFTARSRSDNYHRGARCPMTPTPLRGITADFKIFAKPPRALFFR